MSKIQKKPSLADFTVRYLFLQLDFSVDFTKNLLIQLNFTFHLAPRKISKIQKKPTLADFTVGYLFLQLDFSVDLTNNSVELTYFL